MPAPPTPSPTPTLPVPMPGIGTTDHPLIVQLQQHKDWWESLVPWAPLLGTIVAALIAAWMVQNSIKQKREADNRAEWWRRVQWALDSSTSDSETKRLYGYRTLAVLGESPLASDDDLLVLVAAWEGAIPENTTNLVTVEVQEDTGPIEPPNDRGEEPRDD